MRFPAASLPQAFREPAVRRYLAYAGVALALDATTKLMAVSWLSDDRVVALNDFFSFLLVWNTGGAGGVSLGPFTAQLNVLITVLALFLVGSVMRPLSAYDARASVALGLVSGGALGNLGSILSGPHGVADFIGMRITSDTTIVANVADFMLWSGALLLAPVAWTLVQRARAEQMVRG